MMTKKNKMKTPPTIDKLAWVSAVKEICSELGWVHRVNTSEENIIIICPLPNDKAFKGIFFVISSLVRRVTIYVTYRTTVGQDHWNLIAQTIARVNFGLLGGCLELDPEHGEVRYRDGLLLSMSVVDIELLRTLVGTSLSESMRYQSVIENALAGQSLKMESICGNNRIPDEM